MFLGTKIIIFQTQLKKQTNTLPCKIGFVFYLKFEFNPNYALENLLRYEITSKTNTLLHFSI